MSGLKAGVSFPLDTVRLPSMAPRLVASPPTPTGTVPLLVINILSKKPLR